MWMELAEHLARKHGFWGHKMPYEEYFWVDAMDLLDKAKELEEAEDVGATVARMMLENRR